MLFNGRFQKFSKNTHSAQTSTFRGRSAESPGCDPACGSCPRGASSATGCAFPSCSPCCSRCGMKSRDRESLGSMKGKLCSGPASQTYTFRTTFVFAKPVTTTLERDALTLTGPSPCRMRILLIFIGSIVPTCSSPSMPGKKGNYNVYEYYLS